MARMRATGSSGDRKSTRLNSSHLGISYAVFCLKKNNGISWVVIILLLLRELKPTPWEQRPGGQETTTTTPRSPPVPMAYFVFLFFLNEGAPPEFYPFSLPAPFQI